MEMIDWLIESYNNGNLIKLITIATFLVLIIGGGIFWYKKLFITPTKVGIEYDHSSAISRISSEQELINNRICIMFYFLKLVGLKDKATSIKSIDFYVKYNGKWIKGNYVRIKVQSIADKEGAEKRCIVLGNKTQNIVVGDWTEIYEVYNKKIEYGEVLLGSAIYYFDLAEQEILDVSKIKFIITDNFDRGYIYKGKMDLSTTALEKKINVLDYNININ